MTGCKTMDTFTFDLTNDQRELCAWVAREARAGTTRIWYADLKAVLDIEDDAEITHIVRELRERCDAIHKMVRSPIVNTNSPYFDLHRDADWIWDDYCRAETETLDAVLDSQDLGDLGESRNSRYECLTCVA